MLGKGGGGWGGTALAFYTDMKSFYYTPDILLWQNAHTHY